MEIYTKLIVTNSLTDINRMDVFNSIKRYFIYLWVIDNYQNLKYDSSITENIKLYISKYFLNKNLFFLSEDLEKLYDLIKNSRTNMNNEISFPYFLRKQLANYMYRNVDTMQFASEFNNKNEIVQYSIEYFTLLKTDLNKAILDVSPTEIKQVLADVLLKNMFNKYLENNVDGVLATYLKEGHRKQLQSSEVSNIRVKSSVDNIDDLSNEEMTKLLAMFVKDLCSPIGIETNMIEDYKDIIKLAQGSCNTDDILEVKNYITNNILGMSLVYNQSKFNYIGGLEEDIGNEIVDSMIESAVASLSDYNNYDKYKELITLYRSEYLTNVFFKYFNIEDENNTDLPDVIDESEIKQIYTRYGIDFNQSPYYYNYTASYIKYIYTDAQYIQSNIEEMNNKVVNEYFDEYFKYYLWHKWIIDTTSNRAVFNTDTHHLVPDTLDTIDEIKPEYEKIKNVNVIKDTDLFTNNDIEEAYNVQPKQDPNGINSDNFKQYVTGILTKRIAGFKYYRFDKNGYVITLDDKSTVIKYIYRYKYYKRIISFIESLDANKVEELVTEFNKFYESLYQN